MTPRAVGIGWQVGLPSGWGTYGVNLALELARHDIDPELFFVAPVLNIPPAQVDQLQGALSRQRDNLNRFRQGNSQFAYPMLHALSDKLSLPDILAPLRGQPEFGLVFFESATIPQANIEQAKRFRLIITGSTWNAEVLKKHGVSAVRNCFQGVDLGLFKPGPHSGRYDGRFAVFSGGKTEYRKGQDLVLAAFKRFHERHPDSVLVTAWHSPWPQSAETLSMSTHLLAQPTLGADGRLDLKKWAVANGIPEGAFIDLGSLANTETPSILRDVDVALLPSRCEGGTNLVAMECMACGVPVILSRNTGHLDLLQPDNGYALELQIPIGAVTGRKEYEDWGESSVEEIVSRLEDAYTDRADRLQRGATAAQFMKAWGWPDQIGRLIDTISEFTD